MADASKIPTDSTSPKAKRQKISEIDDKGEHWPSVHDYIKDLSDFRPEKVLSNNTNRKTVCLQGAFRDRDGVGLVILEKSAFAEKHFEGEGDYFADSELRRKFRNDIYGDYEFFPRIELNGIKTTIIHPATEKHIKKYALQNIYVVDETPDIYNKITLPFIEKEQFDLQWVYNILEHKAEEDRIVYEDDDPKTGFVLLPDLKWDGKTQETLYLLAIARPRGVKSLRDLTSEHLPLLNNIKKKAIQAIEDKYKLGASQLRIYVHYQPSFYHLHVHFTYIKHDAPGIYAERSHLLSNVISNIELLGNYYQKVTLPFVVQETNNLFAKYEQEGVLKRVPSKL